MSPLCRLSSSGRFVALVLKSSESVMGGGLEVVAGAPPPVGKAGDDVDGCIWSWLRKTIVLQSVTSAVSVTVRRDIVDSV